MGQAFLLKATSPWDYLNVPKYVLQIVAEIRIRYTEKLWDTVCLLPSVTMLQC